MQLLDTPFRNLSSCEDLEFNGVVPEPRSGSAIAVSQGQLYIFSGLSTPKDDEESLLFRDLIMLEVECDGIVCVESIPQNDHWPAPRTGEV